MTIIKEFQRKIEEKNRVLKSAKKLFDATDDIIDLFGKGIFPYKGNAFKTKQKDRRRIRRKRIRKKKDDYKNFIKYIDNESKGISYELFKKHFYSSVPSALVTII